jgi:hypothetical protein
MAGRAGFEPATNSFEGCDSIQLSYRPGAIARQRPTVFARNRQDCLAHLPQAHVAQERPFLISNGRNLIGEAPSSETEQVLLSVNASRLAVDQPLTKPMATRPTKALEVPNSSLCEPMRTNFTRSGVVW